MKNTPLPKKIKKTQEVPNTTPYPVQLDVDVIYTEEHKNHAPNKVYKFKTKLSNSYKKNQKLIKKLEKILEEIE